MALRGSSFCQLMKGCSVVRSPIQRTNLIMKDPNYRKCFQLWQFMERYDKVGYSIQVKDSALAFDDEYLTQMYTNLINNYAVFKSLVSDDRNLTELASEQREPGGAEVHQGDQGRAGRQLRHPRRGGAQGLRRGSHPSAT